MTLQALPARRDCDWKKLALLPSACDTSFSQFHALKRYCLCESCVKSCKPSEFRRLVNVARALRTTVNFIQAHEVRLLADYRIGDSSHINLPVHALLVVLISPNTS